MATSGTLSTNYFALEGLQVHLHWFRKNISLSNHTSTIYWELRLQTGINLPISVKETYTINIQGREYSGEVDTAMGKDSIKVLVSGTEVLTHNTDGSLTFSYGFTLTRRRIDFGKVSANGTATVDAIPKKALIVKAPSSFTDEENPIIEISRFNDLGQVVEICIANATYNGEENLIIPYRAITGDGSVTMTLTDSDRVALRKYIARGSSATVRFIVRTTYNGLAENSWLISTLTLVNHEPTLAPRVVATDLLTKELTGDSTGGTAIKHISEISFNTRAAARKEATLDYQTIICGSTKLEDYTSNTGTMQDIDSNTFYFTVADSRGIVTKDFVTFSEDNGKFIPYVKLTNKITSTMLDGNGKLTVNIAGMYYNGSFGAKNNSFDIDYSVRDEDGNYITGTESGWSRIIGVEPVVDENYNYTYSFTVEGLDYNKNYTLTLYTIDEVGNAQTISKVIASTPVFDWGRRDFKHNTDVILANNKVIYGTKADGTLMKAVEPCTTGGNLQIGLGGYDDNSGNTNIFGNSIKLDSKTNLRLLAPDGLSINGANLADFVQEEGNSGNWFYRKWNSGRVELYGYQNIDGRDCSNVMGGMFRTAVIYPPDFPFTISSGKTVMTYESDGYGAFVWPTTLTTTAKPPNYYLVRPTSSTSITGKTNFFIQGRWK